MRKAVKTHTVVQACRLGSGSLLEQKLLSQGSLVRKTEDRYEVFSQEAVSGGGEVAYKGDYVKIDSKGYPYPNDKTFFEQNHRQVGVDTYEQQAKPVLVWFLGDAEEELICYLKQHKGLRIDPDSPEACFTAPLWGTVLTAKKDAALVIYEVRYDAGGSICDVMFNFVEAEVFSKTYRIIP